MILVLLIRKAFAGTVFRIEMASDTRFIAALILKRAAIETTRGDFRLMEGFTVKENFLCAGLTGEKMAIGLAMIEYIPLSADADHTSMRIAAADVRRPERMCPVRIARILSLFENYALIASVGEIILRRRPADIGILAIDVAVKTAVAAVYIEPAVKHPRLSVGNIFPAGQIGIEHLPFHEIAPIFLIY